MKRFYKLAEAGPLDSGYTVLLDGRPIKTPAKQPLFLPIKKLADEIANEWNAQLETVEPSSMPFMQYAATAIDRVANQRDTIIEDLSSFGGTDLLCYRATYPEILVQKQSDAWDPLLLWLKETYDVSLHTTTGIAHIKQDENSLNVMQTILARQGDLQLAAIHEIVSLTGSLVVTLAVMAGHLDAEQAFDISELDETHIIEEWGEQAEAAERRKNNKKNLIAATKFLTLCDQ
ncbi:MAG: hypothetical protein JKX94_07880 [Sneathiella sp.]|nr:hypothetical protein [Sneathiella sp.]